MEAIQLVIDRDYPPMNPIEYKFRNVAIDLRHLTTAGTKMFYRMQRTKEALKITRVIGFESNTNYQYHAVLVECSQLAGKHRASEGHVFLKCFFYERGHYLAGYKIDSLAVFFIDPETNSEKRYYNLPLNPSNNLVLKKDDSSELAYLSYLESLEIPVGAGKIKLPSIHTLRLNSLESPSLRLRS